MIWFLACLAVAAAVATVLVATRGGVSYAAPERDRGATADRDRPFDAARLRAVRLPVVVRGYRMADVDALLAALADQLEAAQPTPGNTPTGPDSEGRGPASGAQ